MSMIKFKRILYVLVAISVISFFIAVLMFIAEQREEMRRKLAEQKLAQIIQEKELIQIKLEKTQAIKDELQHDLDLAKEKMQQLDNELLSVKQEMDQLKDKLAKQTVVAGKLRKQLEDEIVKRESLSEELKYAQTQKQELEARFEELRQKKEDLESSLEKTNRKMKVELDKIIVSPRNVLPSRVLVVNKDYNFIITNLGEDRVLKNSVLGIYQSGKLIGKAKVGKTYPNMCSAEIITSSSPIKEGDTIEILE